MPAPYSFINQHMQTYESLKSALKLEKKANEKFDILNSHIYNTVVQPGQIVIVGDDSIAACSGEEAALMNLASKARDSIMANDPSGDGFIVSNHELISTVLGHSSIGIGFAVDAWTKHMESIKTTLDDIDALYKAHLGSGSIQSRESFYSKRSALFEKLENQLNSIGRYGSGLQNTGSIRRMLGISTKSYLHTGEIKGYARTVSSVARASKLIKKGIYLGVVLDTTSTALEIKAACSSGRESQCARAKYVETSKLAGSLGGSALAGVAGTAAATGLCVTVLGLTTGPGALACAVLTGGAFGWAGGEIGSAAGESTGELLYKGFYQ